MRNARNSMLDEHCSLCSTPAKTPAQTLTFVKPLLKKFLKDIDQPPMTATAEACATAPGPPVASTNRRCSKRKKHANKH
jgi:hypothetical protein